MTSTRWPSVLAKAGLLGVDSEERVRGAVERTYRLYPARTALDLETIAAMTIDDHQRGFAAAIAALLAEFDVYLERKGAEPLADLVSYRQFSIWLSDEEKSTFVDELTITVRALMQNRPTPKRRRHMLSTILFPTDAPTGSSTQP